MTMEKPNILKKKTHVITTQTSIEEETRDIKKNDELLDEHIVSREGDVYTCLHCVNNNEIVTAEAKAIISHMREVKIPTSLYSCMLHSFVMFLVKLTNISK